MHTVAIRFASPPGPLWVNDTHSALNRTAVSRVVEPRWVGEVAEAVARARRQRRTARHLRRAPCHGWPAVPHRRHAARHAAAQSRALVRPRPGAHGSGSRHHLAGCHSRIPRIAARTGHGIRHPPETDRRRSPHAGRRGLRQHSRPRPHAPSHSSRTSKVSKSSRPPATSCAAAARNNPSCFATWSAGTDCLASSRR